MILFGVSSSEFQESTNELRRLKILIIFQVQKNLVAAGHSFEIQIVFNWRWLKLEAVKRYILHFDPDFHGSIYQTLFSAEALRYIHDFSLTVDL